MLSIRWKWNIAFPSYIVHYSLCRPLPKATLLSFKYYNSFIWMRLTSDVWWKPMTLVLFAPPLIHFNLKTSSSCCHHCHTLLPKLRPYICQHHTQKSEFSFWSIKSELYSTVMPSLIVKVLFVIFFLLGNMCPKEMTFTKYKLKIGCLLLTNELFTKHLCLKTNRYK